MVQLTAPSADGTRHRILGRRIGVDLRRIANPGIGRYMSCLFRAMLAEKGHEDQFTFIAAKGWCADGFEKANSKLIWSGLPYYSIQEQFGLPYLLKRAGIELFHSPHFLLPPVMPCKSVVTIHDIIYLKFKQDLNNVVARVYYALAIRLGARVAQRIITVSEFSKSEIVSALGVAPSRVVVIPNGVGSEFKRVTDQNSLQKVREKYRLPERFVMDIGVDRKRKNLRRVVEGFARFQRSAGRSMKLVLVGVGDRITRETASAIGALGLEDSVVPVPWVSDTDLPGVYSLASCLVFPSLYEGFGLPVLEAMACGTPVITSCTTALPEVAGEAAVLVDPLAEQQISMALKQVVDDSSYSDILRERGYRQAARFSWRDAADKTDTLYHEVIGVG